MQNLAPHIGIDVRGPFGTCRVPGFAPYDAALGVERDAWRVQLNAENLIS